MITEFFALLFFISGIFLVAGLIKPSFFRRIVKRDISRKNIGIIFGVVAVICFFAIGITAPKVTPEQKVQPETLISEQLNQTEQAITDAGTESIIAQEQSEVAPTNSQNNISQPTPSDSTTTTKTTTPQYTYYSVVNVVDGDTIKINMGGVTETLRLIGIDTPETVDPRKPVQCFGKEASNKAKELLSGQKVRIEKDSTQGDRDKYGRLLAYVYREDGLFFNEYMVKQGYAHEYTYDTPYRYQKEFKADEKYARENQLGLWSPNTCNGDTTSAANISNQTSGKYYTSSYYTSVYYYPEDCSAWEGLSKKYLESYDSLADLLSKYPTKTLSPQCQ